jgi:autotransporter-associated beta strand protein
VTKVGTGTLALGGANTYTSNTILTAGGLIISNVTGSGTGTGNVIVRAGTLGGKGIIAGAVTIGTGSGTGAFLEPSVDASRPAALTIQSPLTFKADGTYTYRLITKRARADQVIANGVTIESGAQFGFIPIANKPLTPGTVFTAISNTSGNPIRGTFANLPDGSTFSAGRNTFQASYEGGDGNDLTLTVVP